MIFFSKKQFFTPGRSQILVWRVSADTPEEFERLLQALQKHSPKLWGGQWPTKLRPWAHNCKLQPYIQVKQPVLEDLVANHKAVELPHAYTELLIGWLKQEYWRLYGNHVHKDGQVAVYWQDRLRWLVNQVSKSGDYVPEPDLHEPSVICDAETMIVGLKIVNNRIENFDLGQRRRVNPVVNQDLSGIDEKFHFCLNLPEEDQEAHWKKEFPYYPISRLEEFREIWNRQRNGSVG